MRGKNQTEPETPDLETVKKDIPEWVKENGAIQVGDLIYGPTQATSYELNPKLVTMALLEAGLTREEVWQLLSVNKTNLESGLRKLRRKDLIAQVLASGKNKVSEKIEFRRGIG